MQQLERRTATAEEQAKTAAAQARTAKQTLQAMQERDARAAQARQLRLALLSDAAQNLRLTWRTLQEGTPNLVALTSAGFSVRQAAENADQFSAETEAQQLLLAWSAVDLAQEAIRLRNSVDAKNALAVALTQVDRAAGLARTAVR